jgi:hypothetical protein
VHVGEIARREVEPQRLRAQSRAGNIEGAHPRTPMSAVRICVILPLANSRLA